ncbi:MAG: flavin reductase [Clostridia bacterium]
MISKITNDVIYIGVNDHDIDLFEGQYIVPNGMSYNSYIVLDEKISIFDTVDVRFTHEWLDNIQEALGNKKPDYLIVQHMEPDHSANINNFIKAYPQTKIVANVKTFNMMEQFFGTSYENNKIIVSDGESLKTGKHTFTFIFAPMVHWPEVMVTYDNYDKILFSADGFGKFGALDINEDWACEARRYYIGIVGKYGQQVQNLLKKASKLEIEKICPLHGPVLSENLSYYINLYNIWSSYNVESEGIVIAYTSVYGNTKAAVEILATKLKEFGCPKVVINDLARCDIAEAVEDAFRYGKLILATTTYNSGIFPFMRDFIEQLTERNFQNRTIGFIENGTWATTAAKIMKNSFINSKNINFAENIVSIKSTLNETSKQSLNKLAEEMCSDYIAQSSEKANKNNLTALFNIGYGLYVITSNDGKKDNGLIVNTVTQVTNTPNRIAVTINKENYSHHIIKQTGIMNINCLSTDAPFSVFENFGFRSGRSVDKFDGLEKLYSDNGLVFLNRNINSFISLKVINYVDLDTHGMFICDVTEARVISDKPTMTYNYYQENVKPKPQIEGITGWVCKVCGFIYEGENLPEDYICPLCKHGIADFEKIK